ncbi:hypothetical protein GCK32_001550 [Trichostrongylus colubriformis]|uniref:Uncharacterized protein n=1 Tax=Trichostrongylus colubriformis TaxID=6319 RepID=A0AAN8F3K8_TRICO
MHNYLSYSYYRAKLGSTYYIPQSTALDENPEVHFDERAGFSGVATISRSNRRKTFETRCLRSSLLTIFIIMAVISGYLFWTMKAFEFHPDVMTSLLIGVFVTSILGSVATVYKNGCLIGVVGTTMISFGIISIILAVVATFDYFNNEAHFIESTRKIYEGFIGSKEGTRLFYTYLVVMGYFIGHAFVFCVVAVMAWILRTHYV